MLVDCYRVVFCFTVRLYVYPSDRLSFLIRMATATTPTAIRMIFKTNCMNSSRQILLFSLLTQNRHPTNQPTNRPTIPASRQPELARCSLELAYQATDRPTRPTKRSKYLKTLIFPATERTNRPTTTAFAAAVEKTIMRTERNKKVANGNFVIMDLPRPPPSYRSLLTSSHELTTNEQQ